MHNAVRSRIATTLNSSDNGQLTTLKREEDLVTFNKKLIRQANLVCKRQIWIGEGEGGRNDEDDIRSQRDG